MSSTEPHRPLDSATILAVDDHPANLLALRAVLEPLGHEIVEATSGAEALRLADERDFVLILMDVHMPGLDGYQTTALLRKVDRLREVPVVFLTAVYHQAEHAHRGYALGAVDYISKPFDPHVLRAKIGALVALYQRGQRTERERSQEYERVKDLFLGTVGHDLRTPLNTVALAAAMICRTGCSEPQHGDHARRIQRGARRMTAMIEDILDLARGQFALGIPLQLRPTDLAAVCRTLLEEMRLMHPDHSLDLEIVGDTGGRWDPDQLARVVSNLVGNAVTHGQDSPVVVAVRGDDDWVTLDVHNRGKPIPQADLQILFEPFRRGENSDRGLGLGLYIVREIVRAHGGHVDVRSSTDETVFMVTLPRNAGP